MSPQMMKVVIANNYFYLRGGSERVLFTDAAALDERAIEVIPFSVQDPKNIATSYSRYFADAVDLRPTSLWKRAQTAVELVYSRRNGEAFSRLLEDTRPDVVHCHNIYGRLTTSILAAAARRKTPVVLTVHDYKLVCPAYLMLRHGRPCSACVDGRYYRCIVHRCHKDSAAASAVYVADAYVSGFAKTYDAVSAFLCPSRFVETLLLKAGIPPERVVYHPNSVIVRDYEACYGRTGYVLYAGH